ncbi:MAG: thymidylate synthase (FAD) [Rhodospirillaceae bacterium]|nr:thymidylate synthase (FAD) [Rhodospirillaceae bacterium]
MAKTDQPISLLTTEQESELSELRAQKFETHRATVQTLEDLLYKPFSVLDHGFIRVVDYMGNDSAVVQAARVSYGAGTRKVREDQGLIRYLIRHRHTTPFEMCEIKFHVKLPIFVARQWIRHRTANINEYSARYSILDNEFYIPAPEHLARQSSTNRQGRGSVLEGSQALTVMRMLRDDATRAHAHYVEMMDISGAEEDQADSPGLARELARMNLTLNFYTQWYWKVNLHNFMHFLSLRGDQHAQYEIRAYANVMLEILKKWVPDTFDAFSDYRLGAAELSAKSIIVLRKMLAGEKVVQSDSGLSKREWRELMELFDTNT